VTQQSIGQTGDVTFCGKGTLAERSFFDARLHRTTDESCAESDGPYFCGGCGNERQLMPRSAAARFFTPPAWSSAR
jgi:hypothetical protein